MNYRRGQVVIMAKNVFLCFLEVQNDQNEKSEAYGFIEGIDQRGFDVCLFNLDCEKPIQPRSIMAIIEEYFEGDLTNLSYFFVSDSSDLLILAYRLFHQVFSGFVYFCNGNGNGNGNGNCNGNDDGNGNGYGNREPHGESASMRS